MSLVAEITCRWICDRCKKSETETCRQHVAGARQLIVSADELFDVSVPPAGWQIITGELLCDDCLYAGAGAETGESPAPANAS